MITVKVDSSVRILEEAVKYEYTLSGSGSSEGLLREM